MATRDDVVGALQTCKDPEIGLDIWALGLIYEIQLQESKVYIKMTFTTPFCPYGPALLDEIKKKVGALEGVTGVDIDLVWDPPWTPPEEVKITFGLS